ncbi:archaellin/type IV pilin N-terminal domain-containing protein [Natronobiforma cellulositropha]|uniref:archaellin/type IV pilin N-terminal domain-containing protein n=1 Tax=Natronobiforma cellulositropha TaxID=1679076 RepID=UPI0021D5FD8A|nr:archaellin/type IV pilin N-terminal domain-containing protein [Natronobiforma cellulositropha]
MFEKITDEEERGQVGIGTLIIFIAMILVAAVAAGVLINTAGLLQTQATNTGSDTQQAVANQIEVVHAVGNVTPENGDRYVDVLNLTVKKSAGSEEIDLSSMTIQYTSDHQDTTLVHGDDADASNFTTEKVAGEDRNEDDTSLIYTEERVKLTLDVSQIEDNGNGLEAGSSVTVLLVDQSGAQFTYGVSVPNTFGDRSVVLV